MSTTRCENCSKSRATLYVALELGAGKWHLAMGVGVAAAPRRKVIAGGCVSRLRQEIQRVKTRLKLPAKTRVVSCYEAGRDGFWLHRALVKLGIENRVVDSASIAVDRRARRIKTDRLDAEKLLAMLCRHDQGERHVWRVLHVPSPEDEDARRPQRELELLKKDRTRLINRVRAIFACEGLRCENVNADLRTELDKFSLPPRAKETVGRLLTTLEVIATQITAIARAVGQERRCSTSVASEQVRTLQLLRGVGPVSAEVLVTELFAWRQIANRRQLGALGGLNPSPYASGGLRHEQGISKAGNRRVRRVMVELAWGWLLYQPQSALARWYQTRFATGGPRRRKIGIVALARKLLVALWRFLEEGLVPDGAELKQTLEVEAR